MNKPLGGCARCDQPATVAITDAPGNARCDMHAQVVFGAEVKPEWEYAGHSACRVEITRLQSRLETRTNEANAYALENERLRTVVDAARLASAEFRGVPVDELGLAVR